jgi:hypothetical protein
MAGPSFVDAQDGVRSLPRCPPLRRSKISLTVNSYHDRMARVVAIALGVFVAADWYALDGKYTHLLRVVAVSVRQHFLGW